MVELYVLAAGAFLGMFVLFLVLSRTLNGIINNLTKLEYLLRKEMDLQKEVLTIRRMLLQETEEDE